MDDLVKRPADRSKARTADDFIRLLRGEECNDCVNNFCTCDVIERAADCIEAQAKRIEELEAALREIVEKTRDAHPMSYRAAERKDG